jgi:hypothetical protein
VGELEYKRLSIFSRLHHNKQHTFSSFFAMSYSRVNQNISTSSPTDSLIEDDNDSLSRFPHPQNTLPPFPFSTQTQLNLWAYLYNQNPSHDPESPSPLCNKCGKRTILQLTHEGRPYYQCKGRHRGGFSCFADLLGCDGDNPECLCGQPSRVGVNRVGVVYYTCVTGGCDLFRFKR